MPRHFEKRSSRRDPATGARLQPKEERLSEYFEPTRGHRFVKRHELLAILTQYHKAVRQNRWYSKLWRWLTARVGSGPVHAVEPPRREES